MPSPLWLITSHFSFSPSARRVENLRAFAARRHCPLMVVEYAVDRRWQLDDSDADIYLRVSGDAWMWQKERLLNLAIEQLPRHCQAVAWLDADLLIPDSEWPQKVLAALERYPLIQPFRYAHHLAEDADSSDLLSAPITMLEQCTASAPENGDDVAHAMSVKKVRADGHYCNGMAWAARRELIARHGLYDAAVIGGGDTDFAAAAYGQFDVAISGHSMNAAQARYYRHWAEPFHADVRGNVGFIDTDIYHLWHGSMQRRRSHDRHTLLSSRGFDPAEHLSRTDSGAWTWNTDNQDLISSVTDYLRYRESPEEPHHAHSLPPVELSTNQ